MTDMCKLLISLLLFNSQNQVDSIFVTKKQIKTLHYSLSIKRIMRKRNVKVSNELTLNNDSTYF